MASGRKDSASSVTVALYDKRIATLPGLERKADNNPYISLGNMFTLLYQSRSLLISSRKYAQGAALGDIQGSCASWSARFYLGNQ